MEIFQYCSLAQRSRSPVQTGPGGLCSPPGSGLWNFPGKDTRVGSLFLLQGDFPDSGIESASLLLAGRLFPSAWEAPYVYKTPAKYRVGLRGPSAGVFSLSVQKSRKQRLSLDSDSRPGVSLAFKGSLLPRQRVPHGLGKAPPSRQGRPHPSRPALPEALLLLLSWGFFQRRGEGVQTLSGDAYSWHARFPPDSSLQTFPGLLQSI